jgi:hypothetical protein
LLQKGAILVRRLRVWGLILTLIWQVGCSWSVAYAAGPACLTTASIAQGYAACIVVQHGGKSQVYRFNSELYRGRGIAVYGSPGAISAKQNTFVGRTKPDPSKPWTVAGGYYVWNGKRVNIAITGLMLPVINMKMYGFQMMCM